MANSSKEQEREELHKAIWNIANDLRGSVDGWDFKQYIRKCAQKSKDNVK